MWWMFGIGIFVGAFIGDVVMGVVSANNINYDIDCAFCEKIKIINKMLDNLNWICYNAYIIKNEVEK